MSGLPARAQQSVVQLPDIYVASDNYSIHASHKAGAGPTKVPVLLIHGTWGNALTWDFPGRLLSVAPGGFVIPADLLPAVPAILFLKFPEALLPSQSQIDEIIFGTDPITGKSTISPDALAAFSAPPILQPDSSIAVVEEVSLCPLSPPVVPACPARTVPWGSITVPALVVDGSLDLLVGEQLANNLFTALGSKNKQLIIFPRNSHGWFLEDNHDDTMHVFDRFLSQF